MVEVFWRTSEFAGGSGETHSGYLQMPASVIDGNSDSPQLVDNSDSAIPADPAADKNSHLTSDATNVGENAPGVGALAAAASRAGTSDETASPTATDNTGIVNALDLSSGQSPVAIAAGVHDNIIVGTAGHLHTMLAHRQSDTFDQAVGAVVGGGRVASNYNLTQPSVSIPPVPVPISPGTSSQASEPTLSSSTVTFSWNASAGATSYEVAVRDLNTNQIVVDQVVSGTSYQATLSPGGSYRWNVDAIDSAGASNFSSPLYFLTQPSVSIPPVPVPISPGTSSQASEPTLSSSTVTFSWNASSGATSYEVAVRDLNTNQIVVDHIVSGTSYQATLSPGGSYRWDVDAIDSAGASNFSSPLYFLTQPSVSIPPVPVPISPGTSSQASEPTLSSSTVTFSWNASSGATSYEVAVRDLNTNQIVVDHIVSGTSYQATLSPGGSYRWDVDAIDSAGASNFSSPLYFLTQATTTDTVPDTPATANSFLTLEQAKAGKIDSTGQDGLAGDSDVYKIVLAAGHTYTFSANANGNTSDTLDQVFIRIYGTDGNLLSPDLSAGGTGTPQFTTPVIPGSGGTYYYAISADGAGTTWKSKTGDYSILVHDNGAQSPTDVVPDTPATANSFLTLEQAKAGKIDSAGQDGLAGDSDVYKIVLAAGHTYTFSANANGNTSDTLDQVFIRIYGTDGNPLSPELTAGGSGTPQFTTPVIPGGGGTYYYAISADGAGTTWKSKTGDYSILVHDNGAQSPTDVVPDTPATANSFLTLEQAKAGKIDSAGQDGLAGDSDVYKIVLAAGHTYTFSANANGNASDTLDQVFIRIYGTDGKALSPDLTAGGSGTPQFTTPVISGGGGTYYYAISADGTGNSWKSKTGDYSILVHDNGAPQANTTTLNATKIQTGTTAAEIVNIALANVGDPWAADGCAAFVWGVTNLAGLPFFDLSDKTTNHSPLSPQDVGYVVPHSAGKYSGTADIAGDGWYLVSSTTSASQLASILQPGDVVRVYKAGNTNEDSVTSTPVAHSFIVVSNSGGNVQVVDNWSGPTIGQHALSDITNSWASNGNFAAAFVSRIDANWVASHVSQTSLQANGFGDWSGLGVPQAPAYSVTANPNPVTEANGATVTFTITRTGTNLPAETLFASTVQNQGSSNVGDYATNINNFAVPFAAGAQTATVTLAITNDTTPEHDETFGFIVQRNASDPITTSLANTTFTIHDDDNGPVTKYVVTPSTGVVVNAAGATVTFNITRSGDLPAETIFASSLAGVNGWSNNNGLFTDLNGKAVTFNQGATSSTTPLTLTLTGNALTEAIANFGFIVQRAVGAIGDFLAQNNISIQAAVAHAAEVSPTIPLPFGEQGVQVTQVFGEGVSEPIDLKDGTKNDHGKIDSAHPADKYLYYAIDFGLVHKQVLAEGTGVVIQSRNSVTDGSNIPAGATTSDGFGNYTTIEYTTTTGGHYFATYMHLQQNSVLVAGTSVSLGTLIGVSGDTGTIDTNGNAHAHLHVTYGGKLVDDGSGYYKSTIQMADGSYDGNLQTAPVKFTAAGDNGTLEDDKSYNGDNFGVCALATEYLQTQVVGPGAPGTLSVVGEIGRTINLALSALGDQCVVTNTDTDKIVVSAVQFGKMAFNEVSGLVIGALNGTSLLHHTVYYNGTAGDDHLDASATDTTIVASGGSGNDTLIAGPLDDTLTGGPGDDMLNGGAGNDTAIYLDATSGVTVSLAVAGAQAVGGGDGSDALTAIENLIGSNFNDVLGGDGLANVLSGGAGNDTLTGNLGNDTLDGGTGLDTASYAGPRSAYTVTRNGSQVTVSGPDGTDTLTSIERLSFSDGVLNLPHSTRDFDNSGKSDLIWRSDGGQASVWLMNGTSPVDQEFVGANPGPTWHIRGSGDFDGDDHADIVWQNDNGQVSIWRMNGAQLVDATWAGSNLGTTSHIRGIGDFDGDGRADILWQDDAGQAMLWLMDGANVLKQQTIGSNPGPTWRIAGTGDFNGDGMTDILWQNTSGQASVWLMNGTTLLDAEWIGSNPGTTWHIKATGDFNGDGKSDILWQNLAGQPSVWLMDGTTRLDAQWVGSSPGTMWHLKGTADLNGDGKSDVLWQNDSGQASAWLMNGTTIADASWIGSNPGASWHLDNSQLLQNEPQQARGDFNGDGRSDILWQNADGQPAMWIMNGTAISSQQWIGGNPGPSWHQRAIGDVNGDGKADIVWQNDDGQASVWIMNGATPIVTSWIGTNPGPGWHVKGAGDFDGDGKADIVWQNDSGQASIWRMSGTAVVDSTWIGANPGPSWHVVTTGDFNGDGLSDIVWQNDNGQASIWLMNGTSVLDAEWVGSNPGSDWHVKGAGDFDGDGKSDLLWQNNNGQAAVWLMNGTSVLDAEWIGSNPGSNWHVKGTADLNGDGKADVLWQNDNGQASTWLMNGISVTNMSLIGSNPGNSWHLFASATG